MNILYADIAIGKVFSVLITYDFLMNWLVKTSILQRIKVPLHFCVTKFYSSAAVCLEFHQCQGANQSFISTLEPFFPIKLNFFFSCPVTRQSFFEKCDGYLAKVSLDTAQLRLAEIPTGQYKWCLGNPFRQKTEQWKAASNEMVDGSKLNTFRPRSEIA